MTIMTQMQAGQFSFLGTTGLQLVTNIMKLKFGQRVLYYEKDEENLENKVQDIAVTATYMHEYNWSKKYATINLTYDPLISTSINKTNSDTNSGTDTQTSSNEYSGTDSTTGNVKNVGTIKNDDTDTHGGTNETTSTTTNNLKDIEKTLTYDNNVMTATAEKDNTGTTENVNVNTDRTTLTSAKLQTNNLEQQDQASTTYGKKETGFQSQTFGHVLTNVGSVTGRDNRTAQELILAEREVAEYNFYEMIANELCDFICTLDYYKEETEDTEGSEYSWM